MSSKEFRNKPIDLTRGQGWDEATWSIHQQSVERAAEKADLGLEYLSITYDNMKVGLIHNAEVTRGEILSLGGCAFNDVNFFVFTKKTENDKPRMTYNSASWSSTTLHEVVHCARFERFSAKNDFVEIAASEGLAYLAQRAYIAKFCGQQLLPQIMDDELSQPDPALQERLKTIASGQLSYTEMSEWFHYYPAGHYVNNGSLIGTQLVQQQLDKGFSIHDLMNQPAGDILGL